MRERTPFFQRVLLGLLPLVLAGCSTPLPGRIPLSEKKVDTIRQQARPAEDLDIKLNVDGDTEEFTLENIRNIPLGVSGLVKLINDPDDTPFYPVVRLKLNETSLRALVDTGSSASLVDLKTAQEAGIIPMTHQEFDAEGNQSVALLTQDSFTPGGQAYHFTGLANRATLGDLKIYKVPIGILDDERGLGGFWWMQDYEVDALVGNDLLSSFDHVTINYNEGLIKPGSGKYKPNPERLIAALPLLKGFTVPVVETVIEGKGPFQTVLDTGVDCGVWIPSNLAEELALPELDAIGEMLTAPGMITDVVYIEGKPKRLNMGGFEIPNVPSLIGLTQVTDEGERYALVGARVLRPYSVTIDYRAQKVYLEKP